MAVLGLIAGLTVPSIVASVKVSKDRAAMKEAVQIISAVVQDMYINGNTNDFILNGHGADTYSTAVGSISNYISSKLNYTKQCLSSDQTSAGCKFGEPNLLPNDSSNITSARWILPSGAKIQARDYNFSKSWVAPDGMLWRVIADAYAPKITEGKDTFLLACNVSDNPTLNIPGWGSVLPVKPGTCGPVDGNYATALGL